MKKIIVLLFIMFAGVNIIKSQNMVNKSIRFDEIMPLMKYKAKGKSLESYKEYGKAKGLDLLYDQKDGAEIFMVWGQNISYQKNGRDESFTSKGDGQRALDLDLTNNGGLYSPIMITLVFENKDAMEKFWTEGLSYGCIVNDKIDDTDIDVTWNNVKGLKLNENSKILKSWKFVYFYDKDGLFFATFQ
jgi:hypothetical protein